MTQNISCQYEVEALGLILKIEATFSDGEAASINHMNPEYASDGAAPKLVEMTVEVDGTGHEIDDVYGHMVYVKELGRSPRPLWDVLEEYAYSKLVG